MNEKEPNILYKAVRKAARLIFDTSSASWFERDLSGDIPEALPEVEVTVSCDTEETVAWIDAHGEKWMKNKKELAVARRQGHVYPNIRHNGQLIGYMKAGTGKVYIDDFKETVRFPRECAFFYDIYVAEGFRGKGLASFIAARMMRHVKEKGCKRVQLHIPGWNKASLSVARKLGFREFCRIRSFRLLNCVRFRKTTPLP